MNALLFAASGAGPKPTLILMHGLPGNERNLDLAQAVRRAGWNVLTFTYRGAWGSPGNFSIHGAVEDAAAALAFARSARGAGLSIDPARLVLAGHSMGGLTAMLTAANQQDLAGLILLDAWNAGKDAAAIRNRRSPRPCRSDPRPGRSRQCASGCDRRKPDRRADRQRQRPQSARRCAAAKEIGAF